MADISGISSALSFGPTIDLLSNAIDGSGREQDQIANNIANVNTPGYRRGTTSFKDALAATLGTPASADDLALKTNDDRQFDINGAVAPQPYDPKAHVDETHQMRVDKSNVDVDQEMALLQQNSGYQQTMTGLLKKQYSWLRQAITEQLG
ncbi:MAG: flagellar basal body rod protein FlgB [Candidatus Eremiobacteraeota bacterium]|nr:flagellar basal body rod protein FlgB [Candidatus Eremiobacteraeota bacterium]